MKNYIAEEDNYFPVNRSYSISLVNSTYASHQSILYCPWCGYKLPKILEKEWNKILEKDYNIISPGFTSKVPFEFKTDKWWKKRGL